MTKLEIIFIGQQIDTSLHQLGIEKKEWRKCTYSEKYEMVEEFLKLQGYFPEIMFTESEEETDDDDE